MAVFTKILKIGNLLILAGLFFIVAGTVMQLAFDGEFSNPYHSGLLVFVLMFPVIFLVCAFFNYRSVRQYDSQEAWAGLEVYAVNIIAGGAAAYVFLEMVRRPKPLALAAVAVYLAANLTHAILTRRY